MGLVLWSSTANPQPAASASSPVRVLVDSFQIQLPVSAFKLVTVDNPKYLGSCHPLGDPDEAPAS